jgi:hypothetical protein
VDFSRGFWRSEKVNSSGWASSLWKKENFGVCGELWWIVGFASGPSLVAWAFTCVLWIDFCAQNVDRSW